MLCAVGCRVGRCGGVWECGVWYCNPESFPNVCARECNIFLLHRILSYFFILYTTIYYPVAYNPTVIQIIYKLSRAPKTAAFRKKQGYNDYCPPFFIGFSCTLRPLPDMAQGGDFWMERIVTKQNRCVVPPPHSHLKPHISSSPLSYSHPTQPYFLHLFLLF